MQFTVIASQSAPHQLRHQEVMAAGLKKLGVPVKLAHSLKADTQFVACWGWRHGKQMRDQGHEVIVMERAYLGDRFLWTSLAWNGLNGHGDFGTQPNDGGARFSDNFGMKPWRTTPGKNVLIMGQVPGDASLQGRNMMPWYEAVATLAADAYQLPVMFRQHPGAIKRGIRQNPRHCAKSFGELDEALNEAHVVITFNSNSAVDAVIAGVPAITMDKGTMAWDVTAHTIGDRVMPDRTEWANKLAWKQWQLNEIMDGSALVSLLEMKNR